MNGNVCTYPGRNSVWILDGASIHCDSKIIYYLRSLGIYVLYLPAYCPFFNPIEIMFGVIKSHLQRSYVENCSLREMKIFLASTFNNFRLQNMTIIFKKCGYVGPGLFDPGQAFSQDIRNFGF